MYCQRCRRSLRNSEGIKCSICESRYHPRCVAEAIGDPRESGDRAYQWKCAVCKKSASRMHAEGTCTRDIANLFSVVNALSDKFELVNKIQLPKLSSDLAQVKSVTDRITKQNEDILQKIETIEKEYKNKDRCCATSLSCRGKMFNGSVKSIRAFEEANEYAPASAAEKTVRFRTRRRSYLFYTMFHLLNRKLHRSRTVRRK